MLEQSHTYTNPADRAAAGFYISNGNNHIVGNAASGGFAGYAFPLLPKPIGGADLGIVPTQIPINQFDGNTAHTAGYFWHDSGCVYVGGVLEDVGGKLVYQSGRPKWEYLRNVQDVFTNTKTFLCTIGLAHWGNKSRLVNFESWDNGLMAQLFGSSSVKSAIVTGVTGNTAYLKSRPVGGYRTGFRFHDTHTQTILRDVVFRSFRKDESPGARRSDDNCALSALADSDEHTPQRMNATAGLHFDGVDDSQRLLSTIRVPWHPEIST